MKKTHPQAVVAGSSPERKAREAALELLGDFKPRDAATLYNSLLGIPGVGTTRLFNVLRELEAEGEIVVERADRKVKSYRLAIATIEELEGPRELVVVGWDGASRPMLRYADEMALPDSVRSIVTAEDRARYDAANATEGNLLDEPETAGRVYLEETPVGVRMLEPDEAPRSFGAPPQDQAVAFFVETVESRLAAGVVDAGIYLEETRISLANDADAIACDELLQEDQKREKLARIKAKRAELLRIQTAHFSGASSVAIPHPIEPEPYFSSEAQEVFTPGDVVYDLQTLRDAVYTGRRADAGDVAIVRFLGDAEPTEVSHRDIRQKYR